ncbi:MAG: DUF4422 domain-containing protein [Alphaproteobacteria bacterium]
MMLFISHLPIDVRPDPWVMAVGVGGLSLDGGISDRMTGFSRLNPRLCEWTGILTAASLLRTGRLATDSPWIGTCHYRRLLWLTAVPHGTTRPHFHCATGNAMAACRALIEPWFVADILARHDAIVPRAYTYDLPMTSRYAKDHHAEDWDVFLEVMGERYGGVVRPFFDRTRSLVRCNMFVMAKDRFLAFCDEALAVIEELLVRLTPHEDFYQNRAIGFLMERFVTFLVDHSGMRVYDTPMVLLDPRARG